MRTLFYNYQNLLVRPIAEDEDAKWNELMASHHYLGFKSMLGQQIKYVAILDGNWVGLLGWASAALKSHDRDRFLGWNSFNTFGRLRFMAGNWRFLILPGIRVQNLASKILSLNLKRLSFDWLAKYGHPILLVETFVSASEFTGACYKANNWILVGKTKGFRKSHDGYHHHGEEKLIFVKPLVKNAIAKLKGIKGELPMVDIDRLPILGRNGLFELVKRVPDHRERSGLRHRGPGILALAVLATLSGAKGYKDISAWVSTVSDAMLANLWLKKAPSVSTIRRFLMGLDANLVDNLITEWLLENIDLCGQQIALDGKVLRGSYDGTIPTVKLVAAVVVPRGIVLAQSRIPETTNEIPIVQAMIKALPIEGKDVTISGDAIHSQDHTSQIICDKKADSLFILKGNQPTYKAEVKNALSNSAFFPSNT